MDKPKHLEVGARVPSVNFRTRKGDEWVDLTSSYIFKEKTVVVFALSLIHI